MKPFLRGLLVLLVGAAGGYYLGTQYPDISEVKEKIPFLKSDAKEDAVKEMEQESDSTQMEQETDSTAVVNDSL